MMHGRACAQHELPIETAPQRDVCTRATAPILSHIALSSTNKAQAQEAAHSEARLLD